MEVLELKNIVKKDMAIDYRRVYNATALMLVAGTQIEKRIELVLENTPMGDVDLKITVMEDLDYPLLPVLKKIREKARILQDEGTIY